MRKSGSGKVQSGGHGALHPEVKVHHLFSDFLPHTPIEFITDTTGVIAIASPWWLPWLQEISEVSALLLPIFGILWIATQIGFKWYYHFKAQQ
jgi:hypothetical protein